MGGEWSQKQEETSVCAEIRKPFHLWEFRGSGETDRMVDKFIKMGGSSKMNVDQIAELLHIDNQLTLELFEAWDGSSRKNTVDPYELLAGIILMERCSFRIRLEKMCKLVCQEPRVRLTVQETCIAFDIAIAALQRVLFPFPDQLRNQSNCVAEHIRNHFSQLGGASDELNLEVLEELWSSSHPLHQLTCSANKRPLCDGRCPKLFGAAVSFGAHERAFHPRFSRRVGQLQWPEVTWKAVPHWQVCTENSDLGPRRLRQGLLPSSTFVDVLRAVCAIGTRHLIKHQEINFSSHYCVTLYAGGHRVDVVVDSAIPCDPGTGKPLFTHSADPTEAWPMVLERACAKVLGSYEHLAAAPFERLFELVSGGRVTKHLLETDVGERQLAICSLLREHLAHGLVVLVRDVVEWEARDNKEQKYSALSDLLPGNYVVGKIRQRNGEASVTLSSPLGPVEELEFEERFLDTSDNEEDDGSFKTDLSFKEFAVEEVAKEVSFSHLFCCTLQDSSWKELVEPVVWEQQTDDTGVLKDEFILRVGKDVDFGGSGRNKEVSIVVSLDVVCPKLLLGKQKPSWLNEFVDPLGLRLFRVNPNGHVDRSEVFAQVGPETGHAVSMSLFHIPCGVYAVVPFHFPVQRLNQGSGKIQPRCEVVVRTSVKSSELYRPEVSKVPLFSLQVDKVGIARCVTRSRGERRSRLGGSTIPNKGHLERAIRIPPLV